MLWNRRKFPINSPNWEKANTQPKSWRKILIKISLRFIRRQRIMQTKIGWPKPLDHESVRVKPNNYPDSASRKSIAKSSLLLSSEVTILCTTSASKSNIFPLKEDPDKKDKHRYYRKTILTNYYINRSSTKRICRVKTRTISSQLGAFTKYLETYK